MPDYSTLLANVHPPPSVRPRLRFVDPDTGKTYEASYVTFDAMAEFEAWLKEEARLLLRQAKDLFGNDEWKKEYDDYCDESLKGKYSFEGEIGQAALRTTRGTVAMAAILFGCSVREMSDLLSRRPTEAGAFLAEVYRASDESQTHEGREGNAAVAAAVAEAIAATNASTLRRSSPPPLSV